MSGSMAMQLQGSILVSMAYFTTREHGDSLVGTITRGHPDIQGVYLAGHTSHWMRWFRELALSLITGRTQESEPRTFPRQHSGADPWGWGLGEPSPRLIVWGN